MLPSTILFPASVSQAKITSPAVGQSATYTCQTEHDPRPQLASSPWTVGGPALIALGGVLITLTVKWIQDRKVARMTCGAIYF